MSKMSTDIKEVCAYINNLLPITNRDWDSHLQKLDKVLDRLKCAGLKVDAQKSFFVHQELEYLGHWVTKQGIKPLQKKVEAILTITPPKTKKQLHSFIGMINYYHNMEHGHSKILAPLASLIPKATPWKWTHIKQLAFNKANIIISQEALLAYPNFNFPFEIHMDASDTQLGV
eukprot:15364499-Ditylum_brightwellii.AAC.1